MAGHEAFPNAAGYDNRGQRRAALMHARNSLRQNPETQCRAGQNGRWFARFAG